MPKSKTKRQMTCKLCGTPGFNSRKCPTKQAVWTKLTQVELDLITKKLGISPSEVSEAQVDYVMSRRPNDFAETTLANEFHHNPDKFELALKMSVLPVETSEPVPQPSQTIETSEPVPEPSQTIETSEPVSQQEEVAVNVAALDASEEEVSEEELSSEPTDFEILEELRWKFSNELSWLVQSEDKDAEVGNSIMTPTFREDGSVHLSVMTTIKGDTVTQYYEFESRDDLDGEMIAAQFYSDFVGGEEDFFPTKDAENEGTMDLFDEDEDESEDFSENEEDTEDLENQSFAEEEELSFDEEDCILDTIPEGALFVGFENNDKGFDVLFYDEDFGYLQGTKVLGFAFSTQLSFEDAENIVKIMPGEVVLEPVDTSDLKMLKFMKPDRIPFELWQEIDVDLTSEEFTAQWLVPVNEDIDPIILGAKIDPVGKRWLVQAVCIEQ